MTKDEILSEIRSIFVDKWTTREGRVIPDTGDIGLCNEGVELEATVMYADMADSTM